MIPTAPPPIQTALNIAHALFGPTVTIRVGNARQDALLDFWRAWARHRVICIDPLSQRGFSAEVADATLLPFAAAAECAQADYYIASNPAESGLVKPEDLQALWPKLHTVQKQVVGTTTLDVACRDLVAETDKITLVLEAYNLLPILRGAAACLGQTVLVLARVVQRPGDYADASTAAVDALFAGQGFVNIAAHETNHPYIEYRAWARAPALQSALEHDALMVSRRHAAMLLMPLTQAVGSDLLHRGLRQSADLDEARKSLAVTQDALYARDQEHADLIEKLRVQSHSLTTTTARLNEAEANLHGMRADLLTAQAASAELSTLRTALAVARAQASELTLLPYDTQSERQANGIGAQIDQSKPLSDLEQIEAILIQERERGAQLEQKLAAQQVAMQQTASELASATEILRLKENELNELAVRQHLMQDELRKAEVQISLIKELVIKDL